MDDPEPGLFAFTDIAIINSEGAMTKNVGDKKITRRSSTRLLCAGIFSFMTFGSFSHAFGKIRIDLSQVREKINLHFDKLAIAGQPYGAYQTGTMEETDLYSSCDITIARHIMGENFLSSLSEDQRKQWINYINSFQNPQDGSYLGRYNHSKLHANGMTIGSLGVLGGRQRYSVKLYDAFNTIEKVEPWLESINWSNQWGASHLFWGGIHCYSLSNHCTKAWLDCIFNWLNENLDPETGWWRKGTKYTDRHQPLGGSVHILPIYQHHNRVFPYPKSLIDSVLALQMPNGRWLSREKDKRQIMHYLELDALYALRYMMELTPGYRTEDINMAVQKYASLVEKYWKGGNDEWKRLHPHRILSIVGTFGILQKLLPKQFVDDRAWTDIFSDIQLYDTKKVEVN